RPREGEVVAARRLRARIVATYGRLIDAVTADALYLEAPFIRQVLAAGAHVVIVLKQEARALYKAADELRAVLAPGLVTEGARTTRLWDLPELDAFPTLGRPVRVVWAEEATGRRRRVGGELQEGLEERRWLWVTDLAEAGATSGDMR